MDDKCRSNINDGNNLLSLIIKTLTTAALAVNQMNVLKLKH